MESFGKVKEESIQKIENLFHVVLPEDYTKFLLDFNGGVILNTEPGEVYLKDIAQFINIDVLYGIDTGKSECDIEYWTDKYFDDLLENTIIIGDSLQQGFIVMICVGENAGVYYYDDSYYFEESNDEGNVYWIAENFEEFWKMLKNY
ncbi:SMI1/KNR4 family protein [Dorea formicigenerans]|uniref:SMI1/KNR4 family protein n=1 Tax=Dorea formicigenerans TaxID=39486 RepID=UPI00156D69E3|nr:SMI1/KNR4 family protein [Dorea formicigenerans]NSK20200.1 SMI1/KNR4 family protein [Dorea formicigenerans]